MKHPSISDFHTVVTEAGVNVTFKPTNSVYTFYRNDIARLGPISFAGVQHGGHDTEAYPPDEVQDMAQQIASEHARAVWSAQETVDNITRLRPVSLASVPQRIASEVAATLRLIQNLGEAD